MKKQLVSIIIPCYQEEKYIKKCLNSLINNEYPKEILVYDGQSTDQTREIVKEIEKQYPFVKLKENPEKQQSFALNKGIKESKGNIIVRCDAHAEYEKDYLEKLVSWLNKDKKIGNVGGSWTNMPANNTLKAKSIAYTLEHFFCVGNSYRTKKKKVGQVDTVPFGAWHKEIFNKVGFFNEKFVKTQDLEFNIRTKKAGYKIILDPSIKIYYYCRENLKKLLAMMYSYGYWKVVVNKETKTLSSLRQLIPPVFALYLVITLLTFFFYPFILLPFLLYLFLIMIFSLQICWQRKQIELFFYNIIVFFLSHFFYGTGYLKGFLDIYILQKKQISSKYQRVTR